MNKAETLLKKIADNLDRRIAGQSEQLELELVLCEAVEVIMNTTPGTGIEEINLVNNAKSSLNVYRKALDKAAADIAEIRKG